ncbi:MAG: allophanate hydrolase subunit 2 family protein [Deltaproteobacteria bacterium]|nr:allophanate hydrolase subunit 2 family protein [Deltaproteobacteria bacterium]
MSLVITRVAGLATIQDLGRPGRMHEGLPRGGALVPALLARANRAAGNPDDTAAIEIFGQLAVRAEQDITVGTDAGSQRLRAGEELELGSEPSRVAYLAMRGGTNTPIILGSRSAHLSAGLGDPLRAGDAIAVGDAAMAETPILPFVAPEMIRVVRGPDRQAFSRKAIEALESGPYCILPASDRVGTRLSGPVLERTAALDVSRPMVRGAIEIPTDGQPIVLGAEHPTTGGYPVVAVIVSDDLDAFHAIRIGGSVTFIAS